MTLIYKKEKEMIKKKYGNFIWMYHAKLTRELRARFIYIQVKKYKVFYN